MAAGTDHLGRVSSVGHNWYDEHVGLNFDPAFQPDAWVEKVESSELRVEGSIAGTFGPGGCGENTESESPHPASPRKRGEGRGGSLAGGIHHETVRIAKERDVFAIFQENMRLATRGNVSPQRMDAFEFLRQSGGPIKFCHIDAAHDYQSVRDALALIQPQLVRGGRLVGHDYDSAHLGPDDLQGGVQRAVRELLPQHAVRGNNWWYAHMTQ